MTIIVFLIDTSASMNQRVFLGGRPTLLDVAKSAVETFVKVRQRSIDSRQDRYMLLTFEEPPSNIKAGWKENLATFMSELKNLQANGLTTLGNALRHTFDVLNVNRMQHGIDTYGQGKCPFYLEPSIIVCITDGGQLSSNSGVQDEIKVQNCMNDLTKEPFRWDQRLFGLVLRMTGQPSGDREIGLVPSDDSAIDAMCEVTGGRSYAITTHRMLHQCIDSLVQKVQAGVVIHFEKYGPDPAPIEGMKIEDEIEVIDEKSGKKTGWHTVRRMIYVPRTNQKGFAGGFWPIPESYWPDQSLPTLPARSAHPNVKFMCQPSEPLVVENFPFDKYELEPSPLTQYIIGRKQPTVCWQVYVPNSSRNNSVGFPFGYMKASTNLTCVNLFVMPYNYPVLLPLVDELFRVHRLKPSSEWRAQFAMYLSSMPPYYAGPLKRALLRMGAGNIAQSIPEENYLSYSVLNYLKKLKAQAKTEYDRTCNEVALRVKSSETRIVTSFKNPFDIPRYQLLDQVARLRTLFFRPSIISAIQHESLHNIPVGQMGNYQEYLKRLPTPLRELESAPRRSHMFGNPFRVNNSIMIDETEKDLQVKLPNKDTNGNGQSNQLPTASRGQKRKVGPLPKDFRFTSYRHRRRHRGMDEDSDTESYLSSAPSSPMTLTPPASPAPSDFVYDKENSVSEQSPKLLDAFSRDRDFRESKTFSSDNLIIDESPPDDAMPFKFMYNNVNDNMNDVDMPEKDENGSTTTDEKYPYDMNGTFNDNDFKPKILNDPLPPLPFHSPPVNGISNSVPVQNDVQNSYVNTNHVVGTNKIKKIKIPAAVTTVQPSPDSQQTISQFDDEKSWKKNLELRVELHKEIRRPVLRLDYILSELSNVTGSYNTKQSFIKCLAKEALRFKRKQLAKALEQQAEVLAQFCRPSAS